MEFCPHDAHTDEPEHLVHTYVHCDGKGYGFEAWPHQFCGEKSEHSAHQSAISVLVRGSGMGPQEREVHPGWCKGIFSVTLI
jgi:hypothetical protein